LKQEDSTANLYVFSSINVTNVWAGIGAGKWAVSRKQAALPGTKTKARSVGIGAFGILYCSDTQEFTTPFVITSMPDATRSIDRIWPEEWWFPFNIHPLGSPDRMIHKDELKETLPSLRTTGSKWNRTLYVQPNFVFQSSPTTFADWQFLYAKLKF
jgi:hypothetical protein